MNGVVTLPFLAKGIGEETFLPLLTTVICHATDPLRLMILIVLEDRPLVMIVVGMAPAASTMKTDFDEKLSQDRTVIWMILWHGLAKAKVGPTDWNQVTDAIGLIDGLATRIDGAKKIKRDARGVEAGVAMRNLDEETVIETIADAMMAIQTTTALRTNKKATGAAKNAIVMMTTGNGVIDVTGTGTVIAGVIRSSNSEAPHLVFFMQPISS